LTIFFDPGFGYPGILCFGNLAGFSKECYAILIPSSCIIMWVPLFHNPFPSVL
jgi:hypothetical protein